MQMNYAQYKKLKTYNKEKIYIYMLTTLIFAKIITRLKLTKLGPNSENKDWRKC